MARVLVMMGERRGDRINPVWAQAQLGAKTRGVEVVFGFADEGVWSAPTLLTQYSGFVLKSRSLTWLHVASGLAAYGAEIVNPYQSTLTVMNKYAVMMILEAASIKVPRSWISGQTHPLPPSAVASWVVKPVYGHRKQGVRPFVGPASQQLVLDPRNDFLQEWVIGRELKVKILGDQVAAFAPDPDSKIYSVGTPVMVDSQLRELALQVAKVLGLSMCGMDVIETPEGFWVIDVNLVPSYRQFPEWTEALADLLVRLLDQTP